MNPKNKSKNSFSGSEDGMPAVERAGSMYIQQLKKPDLFVVKNKATKPG